MSNSPFSNPFAKPSADTGSKDNTKPAAGQQSADDIESFLNSDDDKVDDKKVDDKVDDDDKKEAKVDLIDDDDDDDDKVDDDKKDDKDKIELKDDDDDEDKEKLDLKKEDAETITAPPRKKEIEAAYPDFFKKFPFFDKMMFRDKAYTEMFGSFDEAKEVFGKVERLSEFETQILSGDFRDVLTSAKEANPKAFDKIVDTYLKQLAEVDKAAYDDVVQNFAKSIILGMADEAKRKNNTELRKATELLHEFLFDASIDQWVEPKVRVKEEKSEEASKVEQERAELMRERFETARDTLTVKVDNILKSTIAEYIDPRGNMTDYEKKNAIQETLDRLHKKVAEDPNFRKNLDRLWRGAFGEKFSQNSLDGIKKSYLGKAKDVISTVIKEVRGEVLKGSRSKGKEDKKEEEPTPRSESRKPVNAGRPHQQTTKANERQPGESVEDFFNR